MMDFLKKRPWIWVIIAFVILITAWVFLLRISITHRPESIELPTVETSEQP